MAEWRRAGATSALGRNLSSAASIPAWTRAIQAAKSLFGVGTGEVFQSVFFEHFHLLLRLRQHRLAELRELQPALVRGERLLERELSAFHAGNDLFELVQGGLEARR